MENGKIKITINAKKLAFLLLENSRDSVTKGSLVEDYFWNYIIEKLDEECKLSGKLAIMADYVLSKCSDKKLENLLKKSNEKKIFSYCLGAISNDLQEDEKILDLPKNFKFGLSERLLVDFYLGMFENKKLIKFVPDIKNKSDAKALLIIDYLYSKSLKKENLEGILICNESIQRKLNTISKAYKEGSTKKYILFYETISKIYNMYKKEFAKKCRLYYEKLNKFKHGVVLYLALYSAAFVISCLATRYYLSKKINDKVCYVVVERGDTLSKIAEEYTGNYMLWPKLAEYNKKFYKNFDPNFIKVGQKIYIPCGMIKGK